MSTWKNVLFAFAPFLQFKTILQMFPVCRSSWIQSNNKKTRQRRDPVCEEFLSWGWVNQRSSAAPPSCDLLKILNKQNKPISFLYYPSLFICMHKHAQSAHKQTFAVSNQWLTLNSDLLQLLQKVVMTKDGQEPVVCTDRRTRVTMPLVLIHTKTSKLKA